MNQEFWILLKEDGDGEFVAFGGLFATKELAFKYFPEMYGRVLKEGETFVLEQSIGYFQLTGKPTIMEGSYNINLQRFKDKPELNWTVASVEKVELISE